MAELLRGLVVAVSEEEVGTQVAEAATASSGVLVVDDVSMFNPTGGRLTIDGEPFDYVKTDDEASAITLALPLPADVLEGAMVLVDPLRVEKSAMVLVDGSSDPIPAVVPLNMHDALPVGVRDEERREQVRLTPDGQWSWSVFDIDGVLVRDAVIRNSDDGGNVAGGINEIGDVSAHDLSYVGTFNADTLSMLWDGVPAVEILDLLPRGVVGWGSRIPAVTGIGTTEYAVLAMTIYVPRDCEATVLLSGAVESASPETRFTARVRHTFDPDVAPAPATNTSPILASPFDGSGFVVSRQQTSGAASADNSFHLSMGTQLAAGWYNLRVTIQSYSGALNTVGEFTAHLMDQGPVLLANAADAPISPGTLAAGGTDTGAPTDSKPGYFTRTYDATASKWWSGGGTFKGDGDNQYFGNSSGTGEGNRKSVIWFDKAKIVRDHAGRTIDKVELYLYLHNGGSGNVVAVGSHKDTTPGSNSYDAVDATNRRRQTFDGWSEGQGRWVEITFDKQDWNTPGQIAGVVIGPSSNNTDRYAGGFHGATHRKRPKLRITSIG